MREDSSSWNGRDEREEGSPEPPSRGLKTRGRELVPGTESLQGVGVYLVGEGGEYATLSEAVRVLDRGVLEVVSSLIETEDVVVGPGKTFAVEGACDSAAVCFTGGRLVVDGGSLFLGERDDESESELAILDGRFEERDSELVSVTNGGTLSLLRGATLAPLGEVPGSAVAVRVGESSRFRGFGGRVVDGSVVLDEGSEGFVRGGLYQTRFGSALVVRGRLSEISGGSFRCLGGVPGQSAGGFPEPGPGVCIDGGEVGTIAACGMFSDASHGLLIRRGGHVGEMAGGKFQSTRPLQGRGGDGERPWCGALVEPSEDGSRVIGSIGGGAFVGAPGLGNAGAIGEIAGGVFVGTGSGPFACGLLNGLGADLPSNRAEISEVLGGKFAGVVAGIWNATTRSAPDAAARPAVIGSVEAADATGSGSRSIGCGILNEGGEIGSIGSRTVARGGRHGLLNSPSEGVGGAIGAIRDAFFMLTEGSESFASAIYNAVLPGEDGPLRATIGSLEQVRCNYGATAWYGMVNAGEIGRVSDSLFVGHAAGVVNRPGARIAVLESGTYWGYGQEGRFAREWTAYNHVYGYLNQSAEPTEVEPGATGPLGSGRFLGATGALGGIDADGDGMVDNIVLPAGYALVVCPRKRLPSRHLGSSEQLFCYLRKVPGV